MIPMPVPINVNGPHFHMMFAISRDKGRMDALQGKPYDPSSTWDMTAYHYEYRAVKDKPMIDALCNIAGACESGKITRAQAVERWQRFKP